MRAQEKISAIAAGADSSDEAQPTIASAWSGDISVTTSASKQVAADLEEKVKQLEKANSKLRISEKRCAALKSKLKASKKRARELEKASKEKPPNKKHSPEPKEAEASFLNLSAVSIAAVCGDSSDEREPPEPESSPDPAPKIPAKDTLYEGLNSVLRTYKAGKLHPNKTTATKTV